MGNRSVFYSRTLSQELINQNLATLKNEFELDDLILTSFLEANDYDLQKTRDYILHIEADSMPLTIHTNQTDEENQVNSFNYYQRSAMAASSDMIMNELTPIGSLAHSYGSTDSFEIVEADRSLPLEEVLRRQKACNDALRKEKEKLEEENKRLSFDLGFMGSILEGKSKFPS